MVCIEEIVLRRHDMKKKYLTVIFSGILMAAFGVFSACSQAVAPQEDIYDTLNALVVQAKDEVALTVSSTLNGETLNGTFTAIQEENGMRVTYTYEQLSTFEEGENGYIIPDSYKTIYQGTMLISDGKVIEQDGDPTDIAIEQITAAGMKFEKGYFSNVTSKEGSFQAEVTSPSDFLQVEINCSEMRVDVAYKQGNIDFITISYTSSVGSQIVLSYAFS